MSASSFQVRLSTFSLPVLLNNLQPDLVLYAGMVPMDPSVFDDPFTVEAGKHDVITSLAAVLRKRQSDEANARKVVESLTRKKQKLQQEHQHVTEQRNREIARIQEEIEVKNNRLLQLKSESDDQFAAFQREEADIIAEQTTAEATLETEKENLQKWSRLNSLLHDDDLH